MRPRLELKEIQVISFDGSDGTAADISTPPVEKAPFTVPRGSVRGLVVIFDYHKVGNLILMPCKKFESNDPNQGARQKGWAYRSLEPGTVA